MVKDLYPVGSVVRFKKTGVFALICEHVFLKDNKNFLHYEGLIEGKPDPDAWYAFYPEEVELENLPPHGFVAPTRKYSR